MRSIHPFIALLWLWLPLLVLARVDPAPHRLRARGRGRSTSPPRSSSPSRSPSKGPGSSSSPIHLNLDLSLRPPGSSGSSSTAHATQQPKKKHVRPAARITDSQLNTKQSLKRKCGNVAGATGPRTGRPPGSFHAQAPPSVHHADDGRHMDLLKGAPKTKWWNVVGAQKASMGRPNRRPDNQRRKKLKMQGHGHGHGYDLNQHPDSHDKYGGGGGKPGSPSGAAGTHSVS